MTPRSALDVLVDLNDKVDRRPGREYQPVPLGFTPLDKTIGTGLRAGRAAAHRRRAGHRQDDDGPPDGAQRRVGRAGQRPVHLLRARRAVPAQPPHRRWSRHWRICPTRPARSRSRTSARRSWARGWRTAADGGPARGQPAASPVARPDRPLRAEPVPHARLADREHGRQHPPARPAASRAVGRSPAPRGRRLPPEGADASPSRRTSRRRSRTSSTASRTSPCPRTCR